MQLKSILSYAVGATLLSVTFSASAEPKELKIAK